MAKTDSDDEADSRHSRGLGSWIGTILGYGTLIAMGLIGAIAFPVGIRHLFAGDIPVIASIAVILMGAICMAVPLAIAYFHLVRTPREQARQHRIMTRYPNQPWMLRPDWAARRMTHSSAGVMIFLWVWLCGWWGFILFIWNVNREKILAAAAKSWGEAALGMIFPIAGLIGLMIAIHVTRNWWRFGRTILRIDTLPGYLGKSFRGSITCGLAGRPQAPVRIAVTCEHLSWVVRGTGKNKRRETTTTMVQERATELPADRVQTMGKSASIPVEIDLPTDGIDSEMADDGTGIRWMLRVATQDASGAQFSAEFEIPVFNA